MDITKVFVLDQQLEEFEITHKEAAVKNLNMTEALDLEIRMIFKIKTFNPYKTCSLFARETFEPDFACP